MDESLLVLLKSNQAPSDDVISTINSIITEPNAKLFSISAEIEKTRRRLEELESEKHAILKTLKPYHIILSPARRLPPDMLQEIFCRCLRIDQYPTMSAKDAPLLLTRVCRMWRDVAVSTPQLWTRLHIPWCEAHNTVQFKRRWNAMQRRFTAVEEWLHKSGDLPLSLSLHFAYTSCDSQMRESTDIARKLKSLESSSAERLLHLLVPFARRLKELDLSLPQDVFKEIDLLPKLVDLPILQTIRIRDMHSFNFFAASNLFNLPSLYRMTLTTACREWNPIPLATTSNLTELNLLHTPLSLEYAITVFENIRQLKHCSLTISEGHHHQQIQTWPMSISLPCLKTLHVRESMHTRTGSMTKFFNSIYAPNLTWVSHHRHPYFYPHVATNNIARRVQFEALDFIRRCNLKRLSFDQYTLDSSAFEDILRASPSIHHLDIGYPPGEAGFADRGGLQDLDDLDIVTPLIHSTKRQPEDISGIFLPNLAVFEAWCPNIITDESVLRFILSRLSPIPDNSISNLKMVRIYFLRSMQDDIAPRVLEHAKKLGLEFELDLSYNPMFVAPKRDPSSTSYGISEQDSINNSFYPYRACFPEFQV